MARKTTQVLSFITLFLSAVVGNATNLPVPPFVQDAGTPATLSASGASTSTTLGASGPTEWAVVTNAGPGAICAKLGDVTVVATTSDVLIPANKTLAIPIGSNTYLAVIAQSGTATVTFTTGTGNPFVATVNPSAGVAGTVTQGAGGTQAAGFGWWDNPDVAVQTRTIDSSLYHSAITVTGLNNAEASTVFTITGLTASTAVLTVRGSADGGNTFTNLNAVSLPTGTAASKDSPLISLDGQYGVNTANFGQVQLWISTAGTGTITTSYTISSTAAFPILAAAPPLAGPFTQIGQGCHVGLGSATCIPASTSIKSLRLQNVSGPTVAANIFCSFFGTVAKYSKTTFIMHNTDPPLDWGPQTGGVPNMALSCLSDTIGVLTATLVAGGTGYGASDVCDIPLNSGTGTPAVVTATTDGSGVVISLVLKSAGSYTVSPTLTAGATGSAAVPCTVGSGLTVTVTVGAELYTAQF